MFDLRYHVASLAAVFIALVLGILVGVGISSRASLNETDRRLLNAEIARLQGQRDAASKRAADLTEAQRAAQAVVKEAYPVLMLERLRGRRIALLYVGPVDARVGGSIDRALSDAGAPPVLRLRALKVPIDERTIDNLLAKRPAFTDYLGGSGLGPLGRALGEELVTGGDTPLWQTLSGALVAERTGTPRRPADGVVVVRSVKAQQGATARFLAGLYAGLGAGSAPVVGVESSSADPSAVQAYRKVGLSSVDDVETPAGRLALVLLLAGGRPGHYGLKQTAEDGVLPSLASLPRQPAAGG
jgi:outer membrane murein-binding lipoprotein Lpp